MKIALAQMKMSPNMEENFLKTIDLISSAADNGADLICFPEVQLSPFFAQYKGRDASCWVTTEDSRYVKEICALCRERRIYAVPNFYIEEKGRRYDMSLLINADGKVIGKQKMVHIAQCENFYEQDYYTSSEEGFSVFETPLGRIGIVVCFDRHYPESIRTEALMGADFIIIPTANTSAEPSEMFDWEVRVQAFQNSVNIAMCNRTGKEDGMDFCGGSVVVEPLGNITAHADDSEQLLYADIDMSSASAIRAEQPYTSLRRKDLYL